MKNYVWTCAASRFRSLARFASIHSGLGLDVHVHDQYCCDSDRCRFFSGFVLWSPQCGF